MPRHRYHQLIQQGEAWKSEVKVPQDQVEHRNHWRSSMHTPGAREESDGAPLAVANGSPGALRLAEKLQFFDAQGGAQVEKSGQMFTESLATLSGWKVDGERMFRK